MSDVQSTPLLPLVALGDPAAAACEGDACLVPPASDRALLLRRLDEDRV